MKPRLWQFGLVATISLLCGCRSQQVAKDGIGSRHALLDMYTDQVMDNLIRAHCNLPFIQLAYHDILFSETDTLSGNAGVNQTVVRRTDPSVMKFFELGADASREGVLSFQADPITDQNDIYEEYVAFANDPNRFVCTDAPPPCPVHIMRECDGKYYWVPADAGPKFLAFYLKTTAMRGPEVAPAGFYPVVIMKVEGIKTEEETPEEPPQKYTSYNTVLTFDKPVPNGLATLVADLQNGAKVRIRLTPLAGKDPGSMVQSLNATWTSIMVPVTMEELKDTKARVYSHDYVPELPAEPPTLRKIQKQINRIESKR